MSEGEDEKTMDSNNNGYEEGGGGERTSLMLDKEQGNNEIYSAKKFLAARSFRIGLIFSLILVILIILSVIAVAVGVVVSNRLKSKSQGTTLSLDDIFNSKFRIKYFSGQWANGQLLAMSSEGGVTLYDPATNETTTLIDPDKLNEISGTYGTISKVNPSPYSSQLLLVVNQTKVYRHSFLADYLLYQNGAVSELTKPDGMSEERIQYAEWSPTGNMIVYVIGYDLYLLNTTELSSPIPITNTGTEDGTRYGIPDWVYEEEVLSDNHAVWWSQDGNRLLYASFNDTFVKDYSFPKYGRFEDVYTTIESIPYPKAGAANPTVALHFVDISSPGNVLSLNPPSSLADIDHYFIYTGWLTNSTPFVVWVGRTQNHSEYCFYPNGQSNCEVWHTVDTRGWIEVIEPPLPSLDGSSLFTLLSAPLNDDSFTQLAQLNNGSVTFLTSGEWEVTSIVGRNQDNILFISTQTGSMQQHVYSLSLQAGADPTCLTCSLNGWDLPKSPNSAISESCDFFSVSCDQQLNYCLLSCSGPTVPFSALARFDKDTKMFENVKVLESNNNLREAVAEINLPTVQTFSVPKDSEGPSLDGKMLLPPGFDSRHRYPVLVYVYGGPNSKVVDDRILLSSLSHVFLSSNLSMIVASVDGRGTGLRGDNFKFAVYRDLGHFETIDQLRAGRYLQSLSYVDSSKLAIYGSSYGGYMAGMVGSSGAGVYSAAISQSPVTDWRYYDSIYTERYMLQPSENEDGYKKSSLLYRASSLADVDYLLIHGTGDDNVHFQNTAQLVEALTEANVLFDMQIYTDKAHSLSGGNTRRHLYELIAKFLRLSFKL